MLNLRENKISSYETLIASGILLATVISGLGDIGIFGLSLKGIICVLIVLTLGWKKGIACRNNIWCFYFICTRANGSC